MSKIPQGQMAWIQLSDIAGKVWWWRPHWPHGAPDVSVKGEEGRIGALVFDFHDGNPLSIGCYLQDKETIKLRAQMAILNFQKLIDQILEGDCDT